MQIPSPQPRFAEAETLGVGGVLKPVLKRSHLEQGILGLGRVKEPWFHSIHYAEGSQVSD